MHRNQTSKDNILTESIYGFWKTEIIQVVKGPKTVISLLANSAVYFVVLISLSEGGLKNFFFLIFAGFGHLWFSISIVVWC